ncbi:MAG: hypothetical protein O3A87_07115 [Verrucomicrobia bacterium]|nr:hypothetical protein [Verrucomicrobiota bacterium]MDA1006238.1 hypothetical protein [Verrucomicrobiota bacterium]
MKTNLTLALATALFLSPSLMAEPAAKEKGTEHAHAEITGPNEGKILHEVEPHAELFVTKDRKVQITFLDDHGKAIAPAEQTIAVICGERANPTRLTLAKEGDSFLSDKPLPDGKNIPTVLQIKVKPDAKMVMIRLNLDLNDCGGCKHLEYACTCDHDDE